jgi:hypothetical protein
MVIGNPNGQLAIQEIPIEQWRNDKFHAEYNVILPEE